MGVPLSQRRIWRTYLAVNVVFALVSGLYTAYTFLYLKHALTGAGCTSGTILDNLLFILVVSMVFEFFAEPVTGDWADTYGRRRVVVGTFVGLSLSFATYWLVSHAGDRSTIVTLAVVAELFFAISAAMFNGALDAWFVDELRLAGGPTGAALLPLFARQRRWVGVSLVAAGVLSLWVASRVFTAVPWLVAAAVTALAAAWVGARLVEHRAPAAPEHPTHVRIRLRLGRAFAVRELRNALVVSSVIYTCWICFMYLLPVLLTEPRVVADAGPLAGVLESYYWYYLAMGASRFLGPYLASAIRPHASQRARFRAWGVLNGGALALGGLALLAGSAALVPVALVLFWLTKVAEEAFKPARSTYLNDLVVDSNDRAFVLSMATPLGAVIILLGAAVLMVAQRAFGALDEVSVSVPLLFAMLGGLGVAVTLRLSSSSTRASAAARSRRRRASTPGTSSSQDETPSAARRSG